MNFTAYGLEIESQFPLPELLPGTNRHPDIAIRYGDVPLSLPDPAAKGVAWEAQPGTLLLRVHGVARFLVRDGRDIVIERSPNSRDEDVNAFLLGSALGAVLHQRGMLVLHASAIQTPEGAVLFLGKSGSGKSTLLAALLKRGHVMLADDVTGVTLDEDGSPRVLPAFPAACLWPDAATELQQPLHELKRLRTGLQKYLLPVDRLCADPQSVRAIYVLTMHNQIDIRLEPTAPTERVTCLLRYTYRRKYLDGLDLRQTQFRLVVALANAARVIRVTRPTDPFLLSNLVQRIEDDLD